MVQPADSLLSKDPTRSYRTNPAVRCPLLKSKMRAVLVMQVDNATPIVMNLEKSVTLGILGALAL
jgi:hypothetical protein